MAQSEDLIMADILTIGASAIQSYRSALSTVSNNIANLNTDGYTRQVTTTSANMPTEKGGLYIGTGATLDNITRAFSEFNESNLRNSSSDLGAQDPMINYADRIIDVMGSKTAGLTSALDQFFSSANNLASDPASTTLRNAYLRDAEGLAARFREISGQINKTEKETQLAINTELTSMTELGKQLLTVNLVLARNTGARFQSPAQLDQRDSILRDMAKIAKIHVTESASGAVEVRLDSASGTLVADTLRSTEFSATYDAAKPGDFVILANEYGTANPTTSLIGGAVGGLMNFRSQVLAPTVTGLNTLATLVTTEINALQTTGTDANGVRGTDLFDTNVATTGASGFAVLQTDSSKVAAAGLLRITANAGNTGTAKLDYSQIASGTATPAFTLNYATADGYSIGAQAVTLDANGGFTHEAINYKITGTPANGDRFVVGLNTNSIGDNRNMRLVAQLQIKEVTTDGRTLGDGYIDLSGTVGSASTLAKISQEALQVVYDQAVVAKDTISGVSLDQEAADLIRFQQAFQAAAQIIQTSNKLFDSIISIR